jgi:phosphoribosyl-dephospho-CoA transferase
VCGTHFNACGERVKIPYLRHDLIWLNPEIDAGLFAENDQAQQARKWVKNDFPLVVARQSDPLAKASNQIVIGFTLPSAPMRTRVLLKADCAAIIAHRRPILLHDAIQFTPKSWRQTIQKLNELFEKSGVTARIYGSLSSEIFTGIKYLDDASDLDLLMEYGEDTKLTELLAQLVNFPAIPRIDGEILASSGWAVSWRELASAFHSAKPRQVLAKSASEISLMPIDHFMRAKLLAA